MVAVCLQDSVFSAVGEVNPKGTLGKYKSEFNINLCYFLEYNFGPDITAR